MALYISGIDVIDGGLHASASQSRTAYAGARVIMPLGDSITQGYNSTNGAGYRYQLFQRAAAVGKPMEFVGGATPVAGPDSYQGWVFPKAHEGHIGFKIADLAAIANAALAAYGPAIALLMIGTNDIPVDPVGAVGRHASFLDQLHAASAGLAIKVSNLVPSTDDATDVITQTYNTGVAANVAARPSFCTLVDMHAAFLANPTWKTDYFTSGDTVHPNEAGYIVMGNTWHAAID